MYKAVIFDFDGTLADSSKGVFAGIQYALRSIGEKELPVETLKTFIGPPLEVSFETQCNITGEKCIEAVKKYREYYAEKGVYELELYKDTVSTLKELKRLGIRIGVGSSKPELFLNRILEHFEIDKYFDCVSGATLGKPHANKIGIVTDAMEGLGVTDKDSVIMVGDRCYDVEGAHGAGIKCICVLQGGFGTREEFEESGADYIVDTLADVLDLIK